MLTSDGAGRSGVFIAIDANMELLEEDGVADVFGYIKKLRQARRGLVETLVSGPSHFGDQLTLRRTYSHAQRTSTSSYTTH